MYVPIFQVVAVCVPGTMNQTQCVLIPRGDTMFKDATRTAIVQLALSANQDFLQASLLDKANPARDEKLHVAMAKRLSEKAQWLALEIPDFNGAWKADLAVAVYHNQLGEMTKAFDVLMKIREDAPQSTEVWRLAVYNLVSMCNQARRFLPAEMSHSDRPTNDDLAIVRNFWEWYMRLPDGE